MDDTIKIILDVLDMKTPNFLGINFFLNFLKDTCDEKVIEGRRVKFPIYNAFRKNVINCPKMLNTKETWERITQTGDVSNAFVTAFDWDKSPEGYMFWDNFNDMFKKQYRIAQDKGLKYNDTLPKTNLPCVDKHPQAEEMRIMPSEITLKLLRYLNPMCEHCLNKQIDILIDLLKTHECLDAFFTNLRVKPKHKDYETAFTKFLSGGDLRSVIYWAFNWVSVPEGFTFWSQMSDKLNAAITKEIVANARPLTQFINPNIDRTPNGSPVMHVDPISHANNAMPRNNPVYRPPYGYMSQDNNAHPSYPTRPYPTRTAYQDYYDDIYGYDSSYHYRSSRTIPQDIIKMPTNKNYIGIATKAKETVTVNA